MTTLRELPPELMTVGALHPADPGCQEITEEWLGVDARAKLEDLVDAIPKVRIARLKGGKRIEVPHTSELEGLLTLFEKLSRLDSLKSLIELLS